jgi:hypothetical protein
MSIVFAKPDASVVVRGKEAEVVGSPNRSLLDDQGNAHRMLRSARAVGHVH